VRIRRGRPDASPETPAHTRGVGEGNEGSYEKQKGHLADGRSTAERSTGINSGHAEPIDPSMPNLSPP
jgi:hypothetical protein